MAFAILPATPFHNWRVIVDMALYEKGVRRPGDVDLEQAYEGCRSPECFAWIGLLQPTEEEFDSVRREFNLHELAVEDAIHAHQRPKLEVYDDTLFVVLKTARYLDEIDEVELGPTSCGSARPPPFTRSSTASSTTTDRSSARSITTSARSRPTCSHRIGRRRPSGSTS